MRTASACKPGEMSESGLRSTIGNRVYATSVSGVRIPISPPVITAPGNGGLPIRAGSPESDGDSNPRGEHSPVGCVRPRAHARGHRFFAERRNGHPHLSASNYGSRKWGLAYTLRLSTESPHTRKGGRAAECGGLENRFTGTPGNEGSNPSPSARNARSPASQPGFSLPSRTSRSLRFVRYTRS